MSKPGKVLRNLCKKLGVRLTVKRGKKRVYKSVAVLKRQCKSKKKKKKKVIKRKRRFGMAPPPIHLQKALEEQKVQEELYSNIEKFLGGGQHEGIGRKISEHYSNILRQENIKKVIEAAESWPNVYDFVGVDLQGMDIEDYDMSRRFIRFNDINLEEADLEGANLNGHIFVGTGFMNANLKNANLGGDFRGALLKGANLEGANLSFAEFRFANLKNIEVNELTSFNRADFRGADLRGVDLRIIPILFDELKPDFTGAIYNDRPVTINGINYERTYLPRPFTPEQEGMVLDNSNSFGKRRKTKKVKRKRKVKKKKKSKK